MTTHDTFVQNIFIPDTGTFNMSITAQFLSGYAQDPVTLKITGLPGDISVTPDSTSAIPTFTQNFAFYTNHATHGTYNVSIVGSAPGEPSQTYNFTVTVISANCATSLVGSYTGHNACSPSGTYTYTATASATATPNVLTISNFGGYGTEAVATVYLNCDNDSLTIPYGPIGNGVTLSGYGTYTSNGMVIYYNATSTTFAAENCTATFVQ